MRDGIQGMFTGKAGEYAVAAQLLLRRIPVFLPSADIGCDLMTPDGCRIQVKSAHLYNKPDGPCYFFPLPKYKRRATTNTIATMKEKKPFVEICDYVVFWGIEQNRFWVVPAHMADACTGVELGADLKNGPRFVGSIKNMREMKSLGYSNCKIARHYGITATRVRLFLESDRDYAEETVASQMRSCEGRWDFVSEFVRNAVAKSPAQVQEE